MFLDHRVKKKEKIDYLLTTNEIYNVIYQDRKLHVVWSLDDLTSYHLLLIYSVLHKNLTNRYLC